MQHHPSGFGTWKEVSLYDSVLLPCCQATLSRCCWRYLAGVGSRAHGVVGAFVPDIRRPTKGLARGQGFLGSACMLTRAAVGSEAADGFPSLTRFKLDSRSLTSDPARCGRLVSEESLAAEECT